MKDVDWPLATGLLVAFVVLSYARFRWFRARYRRGQSGPPSPPPRDDAP